MQRSMVSKWMGNAALATTAKYANLLSEEQRLIAEEDGERLMSGCPGVDDLGSQDIERLSIAGRDRTAFMGKSDGGDLAVSHADAVPLPASLCDNCTVEPSRLCVVRQNPAAKIVIDNDLDRSLKARAPRTGVETGYAEHEFAYRDRGQIEIGRILRVEPRHDGRVGAQLLRFRDNVCVENDQSSRTWLADRPIPLDGKIHAKVLAKTRAKALAEPSGTGRHGGLDENGADLRFQAAAVSKTPVRADADGFRREDCGRPCFPWDLAIDIRICPLIS